MMKCRVVLAGDSSLFLQGLSLMLESDDLTVVAAVPGLELAAVLRMSGEQPDVVLWDCSANFDQDFLLWAEIRREFPDIRIVVLTEEIDAANANRALAAGSRGLLPRSISLGVLNLSLQLIALGEDLLAVPVSLAGNWQAPPSARPTEAPDLRIPLSSREAQVLQLLGAGEPHKVIACELGVSEATVKVH